MSERDPAAPWLSGLFPYYGAPDLCPDAPHRIPQGPCEDIGQCSGCGSMTFVLRPEGETFGFHARDCSLPSVHEGECVGGGGGHPPGRIRGYWPGYDAEVKAERDWWVSR